MLDRTSRLALSLFFLLLCAHPATAEVWVQTDWSDGDQAALQDLDPVISPGELVLAPDLSQFHLACEPTDYDGIFDLAVWDDRLYLAAGSNPPLVTLIGDILTYDYESRTTTFDYSVDEEGIMILKVHDGIIYSPGCDALRSPYLGSIYYNQGDGWVQKETVPFAVHVFDMFFHAGKIWITTGQGIPNYRACLWSSDDMGETWTEEFSVYASPPDTPFRRLYAATTFNGSIIMQSDMDPELGRFIWELKEDGTVIEHPVHAPTECVAGFQEFQGKLWCRMRYALSSFDGETWTDEPYPVGTPNYTARGITVFQDRMLISGLRRIHATADGETWTTEFNSPDTTLVFETLQDFHGRLYAGCNPRGELYVSGVPAGGYLESAPHGFGNAWTGGTLEWDALLQGPETGVRFQIRSAGTEAGLTEAVYRGSDGTAASWYESSGQSLPSHHDGHLFFQYRVELSSGDPSLAPVLQEFRLVGDDLSSAPPTLGSGPGLKAYPNPFNPRTVLEFQLPEAGPMELAVFDLRGHRVAELAKGMYPAGKQSVAWNGIDAAGRSLPGGIYFARLKTPDGVQTRRLMLVR